MYTKNALSQKTNEPGLPPPLTKKTFYRKRLSHTLFSNQKLRNFSKLEFFLLKGRKILSKSFKRVPNVEILRFFVTSSIHVSNLLVSLNDVKKIIIITLSNILVLIYV